MRQPTGFNLKATQTSRGQHPDLTDSGDLKADAYLPDAQRDLQRTLSDESSAQHFYSQVAAQQRQEPELVQLLVQNKAYADMEAYRAAIQESRGIYAAINGADVHVDDRDIENMSMAEYEKYFDPSQGGAPRPGVIVNHTSRSMRLDDRMSR